MATNKTMRFGEYNVYELERRKRIIKFTCAHLWPATFEADLDNAVNVARTVESLVKDGYTLFNVSDREASGFGKWV